MIREYIETSTGEVVVEYMCDGCTFRDDTDRELTLVGAEGSELLLCRECKVYSHVFVERLASMKSLHEEYKGLDMKSLHEEYRRVMYSNPDWGRYVTCVACDNFAQDLPASTWGSDFNIPVESWETPEGEVTDEIFTFHAEADREWFPVVQETPDGKIEAVPHATYPDHIFGYDGSFTCNKCGSDATETIEDHNLDGTDNNTELMNRLAKLEELMERGEEYE